MRVLSTTPTAHLAFYILLVLGMVHAVFPFLTTVFGTADYFAYRNQQSAVANEIALFENQETLLQLEIQKASLTIQALQLELQKATITANVSLQESINNKETVLEIAKLEADAKKLFFTNLHEQEGKNTELARYRERRLLLEKMAVNWNSGFDRQGFYTSFLIKEKKW